MRMTTDAQAVELTPEVADLLARTLMARIRDLGADGKPIDDSTALAFALLADHANNGQERSGVSRSLRLEAGDVQGGGGQNSPTGLLRMDEVVDLLALSESKVRRLTGDGSLPTVRIGGSVRFRPEDVERLVEENTHRGP